MREPGLEAVVYSRRGSAVAGVVLSLRGRPAYLCSLVYFATRPDDDSGRYGSKRIARPFPCSISLFAVLLAQARLCLRTFTHFTFIMFARLHHANTFLLSLCSQSHAHITHISTFAFCRGIRDLTFFYCCPSALVSYFPSERCRTSSRYSIC